jgi:hypothetical protein
MTQTVSLSKYRILVLVLVFSRDLSGNRLYACGGICISNAELLRYMSLRLV